MAARQGSQIGQTLRYPHVSFGFAVRFVICRHRLRCATVRELPYAFSECANAKLCGLFNARIAAAFHLCTSGILLAFQSCFLRERSPFFMVRGPGARRSVAETIQLREHGGPAQAAIV